VSEPTIAAPPVATSRSKRIIGLDIARAFAIVGMVIVNFKITMSAETNGPQWLRSFAAVFDGRAAATFVVLAGIGASLGSRRQRESGSPHEQRSAQWTLAKRALFLFVIGWAFYPIWPADILHYYGVYLAIGAVFLFASNRTLLRLAAGAIAASFVFIVTFDPFANWDLDDYSYRGINTAEGFARNLFLDGFHPVFPWVAFYLFGMWLGRTDLRNPVWRRTLAIRAAIVVVLTEAAAWIVLGAKGSDLGDLDDESWRWLFAVEPIPPLPLYLAAGAGTAVLVIIGSIWIGDHVSTRLTEPLVSTGQLALTIYVAHVLVGMGVLEEMGRLDDQTLGWAVWTSVLFSAGAILFSWLWRRRFARGPLEALMRRVAG
jgi:uncharacterized membrane protein YeiB